ncbi:ABC transporter ATP-binding protein [Leuconostocaceae bacterium ESL0958]|nr:ABC transporter ATP-binding protein [Leuconostocaceae bacterium ESL0958]
MAYQEHTILAQGDFHLQPGDFQLLMGPSGAGKSTFLKALAGLAPRFGGQVTGQVRLNGRPVADWPANERAQLLAFLFQQPDQQFAMPTVAAELIFALENLGLSAAAIDQRIDWALAKVAITDLRERTLSTLSGGELQKVALAEVLALGARLLLLDEPFTAVDPTSRASLQKLLAQLSQEGYGILIADHDPSGYADRVTAVHRIDQAALQPVTASDFQALAVEAEPRRFPLPDAAAPTLLLAAELTLLNGDVKVLDAANFTLPTGKLIMLNGPNGVGKSTLLRAIARLQPYQGQLTYAGRSILAYRKKAYYRQVGLLFQQATDQFLAVTVQEELDQVLRQTQAGAYWTQERLQSWLQAFQLTGLADRSVYTLSGGQQKKLQILLMAVMAPKLLLADEPLTGLDAAAVQQVLALFLALKKDLGLTILVVSHQRQALAAVADYQLCYQSGQIRYQTEGL